MDRVSPVRRWALVVVVVLAVSGLPAQVVASPSPLGEVLWPPGNVTGASDLVDLGVRGLDASNPIVLGLGNRTGIEAERLNETRTRITIDEEGRKPVSTVQRHEPPHVSRIGVGPNESGNLSELVVPADDLHPLVRVLRNETPGSRLLWVQGPPGSFDVAGKNVNDRIGSLFDRLGLPPIGFSSQHPNRSHARPGPTDPGGVASGFGIGEVCLEPDQEPCRELLRFTGGCEVCKAHTYRIQPRPSDELTEVADGNVSVGGDSNVGRVVTREGRILGVSLPLAVDLNVSALLAPQKARERVDEHLRDRNCLPVDEHGPEGSRLRGPEAMNSAAFQLEADPDTLEPRLPRYRWIQRVVNVSPARENGTYTQEFQADVRQDADTGAIVESRVGFGETHSGYKAADGCHLVPDPSTGGEDENNESRTTSSGEPDRATPPGSGSGSPAQPNRTMNETSPGPRSTPVSGLAVLAALVAAGWLRRDAE